LENMSVDSFAPRP